MITAGCDVGSLTAKAVLLEEGKIIAHKVERAGLKPNLSAESILNLVCKEAGIERSSIDYLVATGYGKGLIKIADESQSEISCHGLAAWWTDNSIRTIIDIGGQDAKAIRVDENGKVIRYFYNDKCASGTGRFLEVMADAMEVPLGEMGDRGLAFKEKISMSNQCVIFAETEVVSLLNEGREVNDIINALHHSLANRTASLAISVTIEDKVAMTGGVAKNKGVFLALEESLKRKLILPKDVDPQIMGALGAAIMGERKLAEK